MSEPRVTIVVVPRERFNFTEYSLETLYKNTEKPFRLVCVDGNSPPHIKRYLEEQSKQKGFQLIRTEHYLTPNQARNLSLPYVETDYVVFIDNDLLVSPGWLTNLVQCADETGAWVVGPLYLEGKPENQVIHMAGGFAHVEEKQGKKGFYERHRFARKRLPEVAPEIQREPTELVEFHCALVRMEVFKRFGPLDEQLMSLAEHIDLCLLVREVGEAVYFEPDAVVTYSVPPPFAWSDLPYFFLRWSHEWNQASLNRFCEKWNLPEDDPFIVNHYAWLSQHRRLALKPVHTRMRRVFHWKYGSWIDRQLMAFMESTAERVFVQTANKQLKA